MIGHSNGKLGKGQKDESYNPWVARFDTNGNNKWIQQFGSKNNLDYPVGVTTDGVGSLYVTGFTDGLLGNTGGVSTSAVDGWLAKLDVNKGKLQKYVGSSNDVISIADPGSIPTIDITDKFVTKEKLPQGDNRINPAEGISTRSSAFNYGQIVSSLGSIFDPKSEGSFTSALAEAVNDGSIVI